MRIIYLKLLILTVLIIPVANTNGQSLNHAGLMPTIDHAGKLSDKWSYSLYYFGMFNLYNDKVNNITDKPGLFIFYSEQAISYNINMHLSVTGSYVYERHNPFNTLYRNENRFYIQATHKYRHNKTDIKHRLRFDGRFIQNRITIDAPFTHRLRYLTGITHPLNASGKYYLQLYNEFFFDTHKTATTIYSENWSYAAIGYKLSAASAMEAGPMYMFWITDNKKTRNNFYYLQLTWTSFIDFTKKQKNIQ